MRRKFEENKQWIKFDGVEQLFSAPEKKTQID